MKKNIFFWLAILAGVLMFVFVGWAFAQHGTIGLYRVNGLFKLLFIVLAIFGVGLIGLALLERRLQSRQPNRRTLLLSISLRAGTLAGIVVFIVAFFYIGMIPGPLKAGESPQLLMEDGSGINGVPNLAITYNTLKPTSDTVKWGLENSGFMLNEEKPSKQHVFTLNDLQPDTKYWYQINNGRKTYFTTPPTNGKPLHFAVASDAHFGTTTSRTDLSLKMLQQIADPANNFNLFFYLGDLVHHGFADTQWQEALQDMSLTTSTVPVKYAIGNHDTLLGGLQHWEAYCAPAGMTLQSGTRLYQRIDVGKVHFLVIDLEWSSESFNAAQSKWLEQQLAGIPQDDWTIVMGHGFYYASGSVVAGWKWYDNPETIKKLTPLFEKYNVDLVFSGHAHEAELLQKTGVTYVINGTFGGALEDNRTYVSPESVWYSNTDFAFVDITINGSAANLVFRDPDGNEIKSITVTKH